MTQIAQIILMALTGAALVLHWTGLSPVGALACLCGAALVALWVTARVAWSLCRA